MIYNFESKLKDIIASCGEDIEISSINDETNLVNDFGFTSISIIELVVELESVFDIEIDDSDLLLETLSTYKELVEILQLKLNKKEENH